MVGFCDRANPDGSRNYSNNQNEVVSPELGKARPEDSDQIDNGPLPVHGDPFSREGAKTCIRLESYAEKGEALRSPALHGNHFD